MTATYDDGSDELARDQARMLLERWSPFARVSRRLLADLVDRSEIVRLDPDEKTDLQAKTSSGGQFDTLVVLGGGIEAAGAGAGKGKPIAVGSFHPSEVEGRAGKRLTIQATGKVGDPQEKKSQRRQEPAYVALLNAGSATPELAWSVEAHRLHQTDTQKSLRSKLNKMCRPELIWCDTDIGSRAHLEPLVHLLAYTIARDLDESTAVVTLGPRAERRAVRIWDREEDYTDGPIELDLPEDSPLNADDLGNLVNWDPKRRRRCHVFVLDLDPSGRRPAALAEDLKFDRIVHLTDRVPDTVPAHLRNLLDDRLFVEGDDVPYYCTFIASVVVARDVRGRVSRGPRSFEARWVRSARRRKTRESYQCLTRIDRDACVVPVDLDGLAEAWRRWNEHPSTPFFDTISDDSISRASVARWGRAVTNRRIGVALSGGGACAYRAGPLLECLERANMPIDVFAGLSGGALVGAFYCHSGLAGFARVVALGPLIQLTVPLAMVTTWPLEMVIDAMMGGTRVEDLEIRLAAVAVALPPNDAPMTQVVVSGTLGEAVRVSGTLPPVFAKTTKGGMSFTDGGAGSVVPAQVARDFGADIVLACNAIPGPSQSNPFPKWLRGAIAIGAPWVQRQIDYYAWHSYFWRQVSQRFLREADVAFEFQPEQLSLLEAGQWIQSATILERARREASGIDEVVQDLKRKWETLGDRWWLRSGGKWSHAAMPKKKTSTPAGKRKSGRRRR